jgi:hypothetical protein
MMKFLIAIVIFQRPFLYEKFGVKYGIINDVMGIAICVFSNLNLVKAMEFMPDEMLQPEKRLTYGKCVNYVLDERKSRIKGGESGSIYKVILDA